MQQDPSVARARLGTKHWLWLAALFACALAFRPQLVGVGPLIPAIRADLEMPFAVAGLLATIPVLCMGLFALPVGAVYRHLGSYRSIALCLAAVAVFGLLRAAAPGQATLLALTVGVGVGMGVGGALLPVVVGERFPRRVGLATGVYATGIQTGSALSAAVAIPVAHAFGSWRASLTAFSLATGGLLVLWAVLARDGRHRRPVLRAQGMPLRDGQAWMLVLIFALVGVAYYGVIAWLPAAYIELGWGEARAGGLIAALNAAAMPGAFGASWASDRLGRIRLLVGFALLLVVAMLGFVLLPAGGFVWAVLYGLSNGSLFALMLTLPVDAGRDAREVAAYSAMMLAGGYIVTALGPVGLGAVRDLTGSFTASLWALVACVSLYALSCAAYARLVPRRTSS